jgi:hypothetical protein
LSSLISLSRDMGFESLESSAAFIEFLRKALLMLHISSDLVLWKQ